MIGALSAQPQYLSGIRRDATAPSSPAPRVVDPWQGFRGVDVYRPSEAPAAPAPPSAAAAPAEGGIKRGFLTKLFLAAMAVSATVSTGTAVLTAAPHAAEPSMSQSVDAALPAKAETAKSEAKSGPPVTLFEDALLKTDPASPQGFPFWNETWATNAMAKRMVAPKELPTEPFSLLRGDTVLTYDAKGRQFDMEGHRVPSKPAEPDRSQPMHRSYARPKVQKGDYVAHGVNFSTLLSNEEFTDATSLTKDEIQALLQKNHSFLATFTQDGRSAAQIIHDAAVEHQISPRVILATLEKENSLVSRTSKPEGWVMRSAMGYGYDDGGSSAGRHSNFAWQVERGTKLLRSLYDDGLSKSLPQTMRVDYGHRKLRINNAATFALMRYTPHTRDTQMRHVGGGNYLFNNVMKRVNSQAQQLERRAADSSTST